ncbi:uncharacterized protein KGF55_003522 [Candida pseudojiufengensis]|uniref:uncharacterized protein n=1 Tax=Candida pseudojiufengensis TaxID=497109 RepID=UPI0022259B05|nr:uncharacterized protein KGF55_003522 [Candida pseudojiufengensis]KAI5962446.1 hypothetical protein KGF55_003522 [Candida pseudojiufengensis]
MDYQIRPNSINRIRSNSIDTSILLCNTCNCIDNNTSNFAQPTPLNSSSSESSELKSSSFFGENIPTLQELLVNEDLVNENEHNLTVHSFLNYLKTLHCNENLEFILDLNYFITLLTNTTTDSSIKENWINLYKKYFQINSEFEINLPCSLSNQLKLNELPSITTLNLCKNYIINEILINLYLKFIKYQNHQNHQNQQNYKFQTDHSIIRRKSEQITHTNSTTTVQNNSLPNNNIRLQRSNTTIPSKQNLPITPPISPPLPQLINSKSPSNHKHNKIIGYDYYSIPLELESSSSNSSNEDQEETNTPRTTRNNSTSSNNNTGGSILNKNLNNMVDNSLNYLNKMKKFKFRRFSNDNDY